MMILRAAINGIIWCVLVAAALTLVPILMLLLIVIGICNGELGFSDAAFGRKWIWEDWSF